MGPDQPASPPPRRKRRRWLLLLLLLLLLGLAAATVVVLSSDDDDEATATTVTSSTVVVSTSAPPSGLVPAGEDFSRPEQIAVDANGDLFVTDIDTQQVIRISDGVSTVLYTGDTGAGESNTFGVAVAPDGVLWFSNGAGVFRFEGDEATQILVNGDQLTGAPFALAFDPDGNLYVSENGHYQILKYDTEGAVTVIAGIGEPGPQAGGVGDAGRATEALLSQNVGVAVDADGNVYVAEGGSTRVRKITPDGTITTFAGGGAIDSAAAEDGTAATDVDFAEVAAVAVDRDGYVYVADPGNDLIMRVDPTGAIERVVGGGTSALDSGAAPTEVRIDEPKAMTFDADGVMFFIDFQRVLRMAPAAS